MLKLLLFLVWLIGSTCRAEWNLVFEDNFNQLNPNNWSAENNIERHHAINSFTQVRVEDGKLIISANTFDNNHYVGFINSKFLVETNSYIEIRAKFRGESGSWQDIWLLDSDMFTNLDDNDINTQEIDIVEYRKFDSYNQDISNGLFRCIHWGNYWPDLEKKCEGIYRPNLNLNDNQYHTIGFYRDKYVYVFYFDGKEISRSLKISTKPMKLIFSMEIRDEFWAGNIPSNGYKGDYIWIDYIKYWKLK